jgi:hypothetical protein
MLPPFAFSGLLAGISSLLFGTIVRLRSTDHRIGRLWFFFTLACALWGLGVLGISFSHDPRSVLWTWRCVYAFAANWIAPFFFHFVIVFTGSRQRRAMFCQYAIASVFFIMAFTPWQYSGVRWFYDSYYCVAGRFYWLSSLWWLTLTLYSHYILLRSYRTSSGIKKMQIKFFFFALAFGFSGGAFDFLPPLGINIYPWGNFTIFLYPLIMSYAILQYRLLDMGLLMRWGIAYAFLVSCLAGLLFGVLFVTEKISHLYFGGIPGVPTLVATAVIVASYEPLRKRIRTFVDHFLFHAPDMQMVLDGFSKALHGAQSLSQTIDNLSQELKKIWHVDQAGIALWATETGGFSLLPHETFQERAIQAMGGRIERADFLVRTLENERRLFKEGVVMQDEITALANRSRLGERATLWKIRRTMRQVGAALCAPIMDGKNLIGFIILSQKTDRTIFNDEDKKILSRVGELISSDLRNFINGNAKDTGWSLTKLSQTSTAG